MKKSHEQGITCPHCNYSYRFSKKTEMKSVKFCPFCGKTLDISKAKTIAIDPSSNSEIHSTGGGPTMVPGHQPENEAIQFSIGPYQILNEIGKGGMGEVFLAYDTSCGRRIALKQIRTDLMEHVQMHNRFLKEARITSQLTHPSIIPIYSIHGTDHHVYYTMPFVHGPTLKEILRKTRLQERKGEPLDHLGGSIPALMRIFLSICQAIAYAHSKGVLHRDIKPENIIIGRFGEVLILDWGLAKLISSKEEDGQENEQENEQVSHPLHQLTHIGKVVGTVNYMAPERAQGLPATVQSDIYSLGVILYQILTLRNPFKRGTLKQFRESLHLESLYDPIEVAPYRDVPRVLSEIVKRCLAPIEQRYETVHELIREIENYIEGRSEWFEIAGLDIGNKEDWEFQENVLIAEHIAITRGTEVSDWVSLMISKSSFSENIKLEGKVYLGERGHGIGFLLSIPEASQRSSLIDGYCLWIGSDQHHSTKLLRSTVEVLQAPEVVLKQNEWHLIRIEKFENNIYLYINNVLQFSYIGHIPLIGTHIGILARDADFLIKDLKVFVGSHSAMVNCLAVPDAFLAHKDYTTALSEYRRIGYAFPGRAEGREAMFRAGITLLEQARHAPADDQLKLYDLALAEFEKLHGTPGAPLEYLGKALAYQALNDFEEEIKCYELAYRRYPKHPLLHILQEHVVYRMHAISRYNRRATYKFALLVVRHLPSAVNENTTKKLLTHLKKHWEPLFFIKDDPGENIPAMSIPLAFWLAKPYILEEIIEDLSHREDAIPPTLSNAIFSLIELKETDIAEKSLNSFLDKKADFEAENPVSIYFLKLALKISNQQLEEALSEIVQLPSEPPNDYERLILYFTQQALLKQKTDLIHAISAHVFTNKIPLSENGRILLDSDRISAYLLEKKWSEAGHLLHEYPLELLNQESTPLHFLYGCWLLATEGKEIAFIHFLGILETPHPRSWNLFSHFYPQNEQAIQNWFKKGFFWEIREYHKQMALFHHCLGDSEKADYYRRTLGE